MLQNRGRGIFDQNFKWAAMCFLLNIISDFDLSPHVKCERLKRNWKYIKPFEIINCDHRRLMWTFFFLKNICCPSRKIINFYYSICPKERKSCPQTIPPVIRRGNGKGKENFTTKHFIWFFFFLMRRRRKYFMEKFNDQRSFLTFSILYFIVSVFSTNYQLKSLTIFQHHFEH